MPTFILQRELITRLLSIISCSMSNLGHCSFSYSSFFSGRVFTHAPDEGWLLSRALKGTEIGRLNAAWVRQNLLYCVYPASTCNKQAVLLNLLLRMALNKWINHSHPNKFIWKCMKLLLGFAAEEMTTRLPLFATVQIETDSDPLKVHWKPCITHICIQSPKLTLTKCRVKGWRCHNIFAFNLFQACVLIIIQILIILFTLYNQNLAYIVHIKPLQWNSEE